MSQLALSDSLNTYVMSLRFNSFSVGTVFIHQNLIIKTVPVLKGLITQVIQSQPYYGANGMSWTYIPQMHHIKS